MPAWRGGRLGAQDSKPTAAADTRPEELPAGSRTVSASAADTKLLNAVPSDDELAT